MVDLFTIPGGIDLLEDIAVSLVCIMVIITRPPLSECFVGESSDIHMAVRSHRSASLDSRISVRLVIAGTGNNNRNLAAGSLIVFPGGPDRGEVLSEAHCAEKAENRGAVILIPFFTQNI